MRGVSLGKYSSRHTALFVKEYGVDYVFVVNKILILMYIAMVVVSDEGDVPVRMRRAAVSEYDKRVTFFDTIVSMVASNTTPMLLISYNLLQSRNGLRSRGHNMTIGPCESGKPNRVIE